MLENKYKEEYIRRVHIVQDYIEEHAGEQMSLDELSLAAGFSKYHFSRIFQSMLNESLAHYVNRIRLERSLFLLAHRADKNMTDIAYESGYTDSAVFSRAFKNYYGISPSEYRREYSKNCKETFLLSEYNKVTAKKEQGDELFPVKGSITIKTLDEKQCIYVRHTGTYESLSRQYANLMQTLFAFADSNNLLDGSNEVLAMYHDNPEFGDENQFRTSICLTVSDQDIELNDDGIIGKMKLEGGMYAVGHFEIKPYEFSDAWNYMYHEWLLGSGYVPRNSSPFELYLNDPNEREDHIIEVDIYVPVEPMLF